MDKKEEIVGGCLNEDCLEIEKRLSDEVGDIHISASKTKMPNREKQTISWVNKYQPKVLENFIFHKEKAEMLRNLVRNEGFSHYIIEGAGGVGKRTMAMALLRELFGSDITEAREEFRVFHLKNESDEGKMLHIHIKVKIAPQHIEVNLTDLKGYITDAIVELFKETETGFKHQESPQENCQAIVLYSAEKLTKDAQLHILNFLKTCRGLYKVIFCCCEVSKFQHLRSLCRVIQLHPPSDKEIVEVLNFIAEQEVIELPHQLAEDIAEMSSCCLQQAIRSFEATWVSNYPFKDGQLIMTGWEEELAMMAESIIEEQTPRRLFTIRQKLIILFEHKVSPTFIFRTLVKELKNLLDDQINLRLEILNNEYIDNNVIDCFAFVGDTTKLLKNKRRTDVQHFLRIEEFVAKFMSYYKWYTDSLDLSKDFALFGMHEH